MATKRQATRGRARPLIALELQGDDTAASIPVVTYLRVSTARQANAGYSVDAQREAVRRLINGGHHIVAEFVEQESGKRNDRPELAKAILACRAHRAELVVARLDRLARNARFLLGVVEGAEHGVRFADMPNLPSGPAGKMMLTVLAGVAEMEAGLISERTKVALAAAKQRGVKLGSPRPKTAAKIARAAWQRQAADRRAAMQRMVQEVARASGAKTLREIATALTARGMRAPRGGASWHATAVRRILSA